MHRLWRATATAALAGLLTLAGCSDESDKKKTPDTGVTPDSTLADQGSTPDAPVTWDTGTPDGAGATEAGATEAGTKEASVTPDAASSQHWKEFSYKPAGKLYGVGGKSATEVYAVGQKGLILKYNGTTWATMTNPVTSSPDLYAVRPWQSYMYAAGAQVILYLSGTNWNKGYTYTTSTYYNFRDIWGPSSSYRMWGVGEMGYYMSYKNSSSPSSSWSSIYMGSSKLKVSLYGVWGTSEKNIWAVGEKGTIFRCKGSSSCTSSSYWNTETSGTTSNLRAIHGFSDKDVFAVGYDGVILHYDGSKWSKMTTNTSTYFQGVWGSSPTNVFAVGHPIFKASDSIFRYDGSKWIRLPPPNTSYCNDVWGPTASEVFVVCNFNILKYKP